jgi:non-homologous end joining protein Ku
VGSLRTGVTLTLGPIATQVNIESAIVSEESLKTVCVGRPATAAQIALDPALAGKVVPHKPTAIKRASACPDCDNTDFGSFKKAKVDHGGFTIIDQEEVASVRESAIGATKDIMQLTAHPIAELRERTIQNGKVYYLTPYKPALAGLYGIIRDTVSRYSNEYGFMCLWTPRTATGLYEVRLYGDTLVMEGRARPEEIKIVQQLVVEVPPINQQQIDLLLPTMAKPFDPEVYSNVYASALAELLASKEAVEGVVGERAKTTKPTITGTVDLTAMLGGMLTQAGVAAPPPTAPVKKRASRAKKKDVA